jgi:hypothetical protein
LDRNPETILAGGDEKDSLRCLPLDNKSFLLENTYKGLPWILSVGRELLNFKIRIANTSEGIYSVNKYLSLKMGNIIQHSILIVYHAEQASDQYLGEIVTNKF